MSKLIELAIKNNVIKELKDINVIEDNSIYLNEESVNYNFKYKEGDIIFVKEYLYSDGKVGTNHLFLIIEDNYAITMDYFCFLISSKSDKLKYNTNKLLSKNNLKKDSIIKLDIIYRIDNSDILFKVGEVTKNQLDNYKNIFIDIYS